MTSLDIILLIGLSTPFLAALTFLVIAIIGEMRGDHPGDDRDAEVVELGDET